MTGLGEYLRGGVSQTGAVKAAPVRFSSHITVELVARVMGIEASQFEALGWLMIQEEAAGVPRDSLAADLGVGVSELDSLVESIVGREGEEAQQLWAIGVASIQTATQLNQHSIGHGWDSIEALAVSKLANQLAAMPGNGDSEQMLRIAAVANKAIRRAKGEGNGMSRKAGLPGDSSPNVNITLQSGNLGSMSLNLAPAIQEQMRNPNRIIDAVANNAKAAERAGTKNLEMLRLKETRGLLEEAPKEVEEKTSPAFDALFESLGKVVDGDA